IIEKAFKTASMGPSRRWRKLSNMQRLLAKKIQVGPNTSVTSRRSLSFSIENKRTRTMDALLFRRCIILTS
ncbi:hypothetical protein BGZ46_006242, partial [Entomortierella lignicola]